MFLPYPIFVLHCPCLVLSSMTCHLLGINFSGFYHPTNHCDQIGRFIALWTTVQSLWQQLVCPNLTHSQVILVKVSKSLSFLVKSFWATLVDIWRVFTGHTATNVCQSNQNRNLVVKGVHETTRERYLKGEFPLSNHLGNWEPNVSE